MPKRLEKIPLHIADLRFFGNNFTSNKGECIFSHLNNRRKEESLQIRDHRQASKGCKRVINSPQCKGLQRIPPGRSKCSCRRSCDTKSLLHRLLTRDTRRCLQEIINASSRMRIGVTNDAEGWMGGHLVCQACKLMGNVNAGNLRQGRSPR